MSSSGRAARSHRFRKAIIACFARWGSKYMSRIRGKKRHELPLNGFVPKPYQKACIERGISSPYAGFFLAPGLGKTMIALLIFRILKRLDVVDELFVIASRRIIYRVWPREIKKWNLGFDFSIVHGSAKVRIERLYERADVRLINYENIPWLIRQSMWRKKLLKRRVMLVVDESSKFKHSNTRRFKAIKKILHRFTRRYILTGSPASNGLMNLFGQIYLLDMGRTLGEFITTYRNEYFIPTGYGGYKWVIAKGAKKRLFKKIKPLVLRFGDKELNLPPLTFKDIYVDLPRKARNAYDEMERDFVIRLKEGEITAANAAVASGKLRQIANGGLYVEDGSNQRKRKGVRPYIRVHDEKCAALVELLEELQGQPALVSYEFGHDKARIQRYFAAHAPEFKDAPFIGGGAKDKEVDIILDRWDRGEIPVLFGQPGSVAHGLNLQEGPAATVIFFSLTWNWEEYDQFIRRIWRQGQKRPVMVYRIRARKTIDSDMCYSIKVKADNEGEFLKAMERRNGIR